MKFRKECCRICSLFLLFPYNERNGSRGQSDLQAPAIQMASEEQEFDLSMPAVVDKYKSAAGVANGTKSLCAKAWNIVERSIETGCVRRTLDIRAF